MNSSSNKPANDYLGSLFNLQGKTALVTGGATGIGYMITHALVSAGAKVYIASRKFEACEKAAESLADLAGSCIPFAADLASEAGVNSLAEFIADNESQLDILVNNSGRSWGAAYEQFPWKAWEDIMTLNVTAPFTLIRQLTPLLSAAGRAGDPSRVINIGSVMGIEPHGFPAYSYSASKAAIHHITRFLSNELAPKNIAVNAIAPGPFPSGMTAFFTEDEKLTKAVTRGIPLARLGRPEDFAGLILCLCGASGAYISGAIIPLDGGMNSARTLGLEQGM
ncbi:MAG: SDR family oxidoreductase [Xanthomonadales bacterium]|nr:SDR family oxidoreductase [Xanthomonadales bacterium]